MNLQSKFGYYIITQTVIIGRCKRDAITDRRMDKQTDGRTDGRSTVITRCPQRTFQSGGMIKNKMCL